jgi:hypothetical protein
LAHLDDVQRVVEQRLRVAAGDQRVRRREYDEDVLVGALVGRAAELGEPAAVLVVVERARQRLAPMVDELGRAGAPEQMARARISASCAC